MEKNYWFAPKRYKYGYTPVTWQGWVCAGVLVILITLMAEINQLFQGAPTIREILHFLFDILILVGFLIFVLKKKIKGLPKWCSFCPKEK
jgi:hypothetical protein